MSDNVKALLGAVALPNKEKLKELKEYVGLVQEIFPKYGGTTLTTKVLAVEGGVGDENLPPLLNIIFVFPSKQSVLDALADKDYVETAVPLRQQAFTRMTAVVLEDVKVGTVLFSPGAIPNMGDDGTLMPYLAAWKEVSSTAGTTNVEGTEPVMDEGTEPAKLIHGFIQFPSMEEMVTLFESEAYKKNAEPLRVTAFKQLRGIAFTVE